MLILYPGALTNLLEGEPRVWLGPDDKAMAKPTFKLVRTLDEIFQDEKKCEKFRIHYTDRLEERSKDEWIPLTP
jgi:hypothetical protein